MRYARRLVLPLLFLALIAPFASAQDLKAEKYTLPNGMVVILHVDKSLPQATINLWYRVGAKNEPVGRSGFAHLFEHLMFMGTARVPGNQFDILMEAKGGNNNASTDLDRTNYFSVGPSELLPTLLWLDADRLEALGANMTQEKLDRQRDIVRNEIRQQVENTPYGRAYEEMFRYMYPAGHPYHNAVYGTHADLESAQLNDVRDFFATFYNPANCSLVVAGDFDPAKIKPLINDLFGSLPAGNPPKDRKVEPVKLDRVVRATQLDKVEQPKLLMVYHAPGVYEPGDADLQLAAGILGQGQNSRLYQRLVLKDQTAVEVSVGPYPGQLQSLLLVDVITKPGADLAAVEKAVDEEIARFVQSGPTPDELKERQASVELANVLALQSLQRRADVLNEYQYYFNDPNSLQRDLDRYRKATVESLKTWAGKVFTQDARLILTVLPESAATKSPRDQQPADATAASFTPPMPETFALPNGTKVVLFRKTELPLVSATVLSTRTGAPIDPVAKAGRTELLAQMFEEGTGDLDGPAFSAAIQTLGGSFGASADRTSLSTSLTVIDRNFAPAAKLWLDATFRPALRADDYTRVKELHLEALKQQDQEPGAVASKVGQALLFGETSPYGVPSDGTLETVGKLTLDDLKGAQAELLGDPTKYTILVAGNITAEQVKAVLTPLVPKGEAIAGSFAAPSIAANKLDGLTVAIVNRPDAPQTAVRFVAPGVNYASPDRTPLSLVNVVLGGSFTSRLNANLREAKGYTYGAGSRWIADPATGWFVASADVKSDVTGPAIKELLAELTKIATGDISPEEAGKARQTYRAGNVERFGSLGSLLGTAASLIEAGVPWESLATDLKAAESATPDQLNALARKYVTPDRGILVLVGDEKLIREQIKDLGLPTPISLDAQGKPAKAGDGN
jgi:predicted Zn-dependent peptidase